MSAYRLELLQRAKGSVGAELLIPAFNWEYRVCVRPITTSFVSENVVSVTLSRFVITSEAFCCFVAEKRPVHMKEPLDRK